jgi:nucleoside-diphosphate-sugar epimerase
MSFNGLIAVEMRILITGATGYVGTNLVDSLWRRGNLLRVLALPGTVGAFGTRERIEVITGDLSLMDVLRRAVADVDTVYHLAALLPGARAETLRSVNVAGTENVLAACLAARVRRLVYVSSVSVYASAPRGFPVAEDYPLRAHGNAAYREYAQSKIDAERILLRPRIRSELEHVIIRAPAVYGPRARWVERLLLRILVSPGAALRAARRSPVMQWVYVSDLVHGLVLGGADLAAANQVFNIAGGEYTGLARVTGVVAKLLAGSRREEGASAVLRQLPACNELKWDIRKAADVLGYTPQVTLDDGLARVLLSLRTVPVPVAAGNRWDSAVALPVRLATGVN